MTTEVLCYSYFWVGLLQMIVWIFVGAFFASTVVFLMMKYAAWLHDRFM